MVYCLNIMFQTNWRPTAGSLILNSLGTGAMGAAAVWIAEMSAIKSGQSVVKVLGRTCGGFAIAYSVASIAIDEQELATY